jgi:hypothetical protein
MSEDKRWWIEGTWYSSLNRDLDEYYMELHDLREILTNDANSCTQRGIQRREAAAIRAPLLSNCV